MSDLKNSAAKALFLGNIIEENLYPFPKINEEEAETINIVIDSIDKFLSSHKEDFVKFDLEGMQSEEFLNNLKELGLFGLIIGEQYGGLGFSNSGYARIVQQVSTHDSSTTLTVAAHSSIGMKGLLLFGTDEQKERYLPRLASGEMIAAFCLTEAGAGSDVASMKTKAERREDGSWVLNGEKIWISNGGIADFFTVFAVTNSEAGKISAFIVERKAEGLTTGPKEDKMGIRASSTTTVNFENVVVPPENVLGEEGKGFKIAMSILNNGRTGLGGGCVGGIKRCIKLAVNQSSERKQFGEPISNFGLIKEKISQMTVDCFATESVVGMVSHYIDSGAEDYSVEAAISKVFASEAMWNASYESLQVAGGNGFMREYPYDMITRDSRINNIFEGTNEILRLYIALSGMKDAGVHLKDIAKSISGIFNDPIKGFGVLSDYAVKRVSRLTSLGRDKLEFTPDVLRTEAAILEAGTQRLAQETEVILRRHGKKIIGRQFAMKRIADITIDLFVGFCVLSRVSSIIAEKSEAESRYEIDIAKIFVAQAKGRIERNFNGVSDNPDEMMKSLSDKIVEEGGYIWDVL